MEARPKPRSFVCDMPAVSRNRKAAGEAGRCACGSIKAPPVYLCTLTSVPCTQDLKFDGRPASVRQAVKSMISMKKIGAIVSSKLKFSQHAQDPSHTTFDDGSGSLKRSNAKIKKRSQGGREFASYLAYHTDPSKIPTDALGMHVPVRKPVPRDSILSEGILPKPSQLPSAAQGTLPQASEVEYGRVRPGATGTQRSPEAENMINYHPVPPTGSFAMWNPPRRASPNAYIAGRDGLCPCGDYSQVTRSFVVRRLGDQLSAELSSNPFNEAMVAQQTWAAKTVSENLSQKAKGKKAVMHGPITGCKTSYGLNPLRVPSSIGQIPQCEHPTRVQPKDDPTRPVEDSIDVLDDGATIVYRRRRKGSEGQAGQSGPSLAVTWDDMASFEAAFQAAFGEEVDFHKSDPQAILAAIEHHNVREMELREIVHNQQTHQLERTHALEEAYYAATITDAIECVCCGDEKACSDFPSGTATRSCTHPIKTCTECLAAWMVSEFDSKGCDGILCPQCPCQLSYYDVQRSASETTFEAYETLLTRNALSRLPEFSWCLASGCESGQLNTENSHYMDCVSCGFKQCLKHCVAWHFGETCAAYAYRVSGQRGRDEEAATAAMLDTVSKLCPGPGCGWRLQKSDGCDHMRCKKCKFEFCWECRASHQEIKKRGNTAHQRTCKFHSENLDISWPFNVHG